MNHVSLLENHLIGFVVPGSHILEELFLVRLDEGKQLAILLEHIFSVILKHDLFEVILPNYLWQGLSSENLARYLLLSPNSHFSDCVIIKGVQSKTLAFVDFSLFNVPSYQGSHSLFDDVKRWARISLFYNVLALVVLKRYEWRGYLLLLPVVQKLIESNTLQISLRILKLLDYNLLNSISKTDFIDDPKGAILSSSYSRRSLYIIQQGQLSKSFSNL